MGDRGRHPLGVTRMIAPVTIRHVNIGWPRPLRTLNAVSLQLQESNLELDSHADTCCIGSGALVIYDCDQPVQVHGYDPSLGSQTFRTV